jgi:hypothetical protein
VLDRVLRIVVTLTLVLFLVQAVIGVLARALEGVLRASLSAIGSVGGILSRALIVLLVACFTVGLVVRGVRFMVSRDPRAIRERAARDRAVRQRVRRPAEGVPTVESHAEVLDDPDPAIGDEERE